MMQSNVLVEMSGLVVFEFDGNACESLDDFVAQGKINGLFAEYCGGNLDAIEECILDRMVELNNLEIIFRNAERFLIDCAERIRLSFYDILSDAVGKARLETGNNNINMVLRFYFPDEYLTAPQEILRLCPFRNFEG